MFTTYIACFIMLCIFIYGKKKSFKKANLTHLNSESR